MAGPTFQTNPVDLKKLLDECHNGVLQLPDFQRSWVWDEERIKSLIASISRSFPIGALMTLITGGPVEFKPRIIEGVPDSAKTVNPQALLLDGQQRITSMYQVTLRKQVVETVTPKNKQVKRWFYIDIQKALDPSIDREEAILGIPENKQLTSQFGRELELDISTPENEYKNLMFPMTDVFDWDSWQDGFDDYWSGDENKSKKELFRQFKRDVLENFKAYRVPVIALERETSKEAVCVVFEKVNTKGKALDAFELVTAIYAADGHELRKDWYGDEKNQGRQQRFSEAYRLADRKQGIISNVSNTDFLQVISLFYTRDKRNEAENLGKHGKELPAVTGNRQALLNLPLSAYKQYEKQAEEGFNKAAKFLHMLHIYQVNDLPYQSQVVPLAAILADIGDDWEHEANRKKLLQWYWNGVFGELYGSAVETRNARDFVEVPAWLKGGPPPSTVTETLFRPDRLKTMKSRLSAAYKGVNALLMKQGALDFRSGQPFDYTVFFGEYVDIHHIFPKDWCTKQGISHKIYDSIINKTPLSYKTNRIIGGAAPSSYLQSLEKGNKETPAIAPADLNQYLSSHCINPELLRADNFNAFMEDRQKQLLALIEQAMGKTAYMGDVQEEGIALEDEALE